MNKTLTISLFTLFGLTGFTAQASVNRTDNHPDSVYLLTYADQYANGGGGLKFAYSIDRQQWTSIGEGYGYVSSDYGAWGSEKKMFHPSVLRKDGTWYVVWALNDRINQFSTTLSPDLCHWKPQDYPYSQAGENVMAPVITYEGGQFIVTYKTSQGHVYQQGSTDFQHWSAPRQANANAYRDVYVEAVIDGRVQHGQCTRVEWSVADEMSLYAQAAHHRGNRNNESMRDDGTRFAKLNGVKATLRIDPTGNKRISDKLIGIFFEDISWAADGGLYAELVQNRDFEYNAMDNGRWNSQTAWSLEGEGTTWSIETSAPIHANNPHYTLLDVASTGASLVNHGYDGINVKQGEKYTLSLWTKLPEGGKQKLNIQITDEGGKVLASTSINATKAWKKQEVKLTCNGTTTNGRLVITPSQTGKVAIDFVSLFPQNTFHGHRNGLRADLAQTIADLKPQFMRFPGGCLAHGNGIDNIYRWKNTIGPLEQRKGDFNIWHYHQTMGLGYFEYFTFCEDMGCEPLPVIAAGVPCQNSSIGGNGQQGGVPWEQMDEFLQDILDLVEWANGDPKTSKWAKMRADAGHPKPFNLKYVGIGNEDLISDVFTERYLYLCKGVQEKYPDITVVGTVGPFFEGSDYEWGWKIAKENKIPIVDEHYYNSPGWFVNNQHFYDNYERNSTTVYLGEYASRGNTLENALSEAIYLTGVERNGDVVEMTSYAPLLARNRHTSWNPDLIYFDNAGVYPTVNYEVQKLYGNNSGTLYIGSRIDITEGGNADVQKRLAASVVKDEKTGDIILKLCNLLPVETTLALDLRGIEGLAGVTEVNATESVLSGRIDDKENKPVMKEVVLKAQGDYVMPMYSFTVLRIKL